MSDIGMFVIGVGPNSTRSAKYLSTEHVASERQGRSVLRFFPILYVLCYIMYADNTYNKYHSKTGINIILPRLVSTGMTIPVWYGILYGRYTRFEY